MFVYRTKTTFPFPRAWMGVPVGRPKSIPLWKSPVLEPSGKVMGSRGPNSDVTYCRQPSLKGLPNSPPI